MLATLYASGNHNFLWVPLHSYESLSRICNFHLVIECVRKSMIECALLLASAPHTCIVCVCFPVAWDF